MAKLGKIFLLTHEAPPFHGGAGTYCVEVARALTKLHPESSVTLVAPRNASVQGVSLMSLNCGEKLSPVHTLQMALALWKHREKWGDGVLILGSYGAHRALLVLSVLGLELPCQVWSLLHGSEIPRFSKSAVRGWLAQKLFQRVTGVFVNSRFTERLLRQSGIFSGAKILLAPCAPSSDAASEQSPRFRATWEKFRILTIARIHPRKGQLESARALALLPSRLKSRLKFVIGGKGDSRYLSEVIAECTRGMVPWEYLGRVDECDLASVYASADCFLMTSRALPMSVEGFGISYLEAAWHGKPSIAFASGGVEEAVLDEKTGFVLPEGDIQGVAQALTRLMEEPTLISDFSREAARFARSFTWNKTAEIIFDSIAAGSEPL